MIMHHDGVRTERCGNFTFRLMLSEIVKITGNGVKLGVNTEAGDILSSLLVKFSPIITCEVVNTRKKILFRI